MNNMSDIFIMSNTFFSVPNNLRETVHNYIRCVQTENEKDTLPLENKAKLLLQRKRVA